MEQDGRSPSLPLGRAMRLDVRVGKPRSGGLRTVRTSSLQADLRGWGWSTPTNRRSCFSSMYSSSCSSRSDRSSISLICKRKSKYYHEVKDKQLLKNHLISHLLSIVNIMMHKKYQYFHLSYSLVHECRPTVFFFNCHNNTISHAHTLLVISW